jgi:pimeloyl-ACP methyl ester carboxylesterase
MICEVDEEIIEGRFSREQTIAQTELCLEALPHDPRFFTTSIAVQDLEALRIALGYEEFNIYGISYGTRVAQHFMRRYPTSTRSVILDGVVPPQIALGPGIAIEAQNTIDAIFDRCGESTDCNERFPNLRNEFAALKARLADAPVNVRLANPRTGVPEDVQLGDQDMAGALRLLSYHPSSVALMPLLIDQAVNGNYLPLAAQFLMISESMSDALNIGMHNAVVCTEDAPYFAGENITTEELEATYIGPLQLEALDAICSVWPQGILDDGFKEPVASDVPVLLLSGEADPITPPAYADLAAVDFANFTHLTGAKQGHGQAPRGCMPDIIGEFVAAADASSLQTDCLERLHAMPFFLDFSGPAP